MTTTHTHANTGENTRGNKTTRKKNQGYPPMKKKVKEEKCLQVIRGDFPVGSRRVITFTFFFDYFPSKIK
jgi:hypothetical protein